MEDYWNSLLIEERAKLLDSFFISKELANVSFNKIPANTKVMLYSYYNRLNK
jgi:hypothetical protein